MKLAVQERIDNVAGIQDEIAISIQANSVAFYAQISGLAKDKIGYSMRELTTNMWDATRLRYGNDVPDDRIPQIFLPTNLNPTIRFRDYGPGMDETAMREIYAQMYASTKRDTDNEVGGWGLGRFSPFAYLIGDGGSGSYTVTSYNGGMARTYVLSLSSDGRPMMRLLAAMPSDEESGMEVSFAVRRHDVSAFTGKAHHILWSFEPRPRIIPAMNWDEPAVLASGEGWVSYNSNTVPFHGPHVRMGPVMYPFDISQVDHTAMISSNDSVLFDTGIGSLSVTLSREALAYDERTVQTLSALVSRYQQSVLDQVQAKVDAAGNYLHACRDFFRATEGYSSARQSWLIERVRYQGRPIIRSFSFADDVAKVMIIRGSYAYDKFEKGYVDVRNISDHQVVIEHNPSYSFERMAAADLSDKNLIWIRTKRDQLAQVMDKLGNPDYTVLDETKIDKSQIAARRKGKTVRNRRVLLVGQTYGANLVTEEIDMAAGGYYVARSQANGYRRGGFSYHIRSGKSVAESTFQDIIRVARDLGVIPIGTRILLRTEKDQLGENWTWIGDTIAPALQAMIDADQFTGLHNKNVYSFDGHVRVLGHKWNFSRAPQDLRVFHEELQTLYEQLRSNNRETTISDKAYAALNNMGETVEVPMVACPIASLNTRYEALKQRYPLLSMIVSNHMYGGGQEAFDHYFSLLETHHAATNHNGHVDHVHGEVSGVDPVF
jgi:hypothetical protein